MPPSPTSTRTADATRSTPICGATVMDTAVKNGVPGIVAECGGFLSCASCHVHVDDAWIDKVGRAEDNDDEDESEILDGAMAERMPGSRLSCQIVVDRAARRAAGPRLAGAVLMSAVVHRRRLPGRPPDRRLAARAGPRGTGHARRRRAATRPTSGRRCRRRTCPAPRRWSRCRCATRRSTASTASTWSAVTGSTTSSSTTARQARQRARAALRPARTDHRCPRRASFPFRAPTWPGCSTCATSTTPTGSPRCFRTRRTSSSSVAASSVSRRQQSAATRASRSPWSRWGRGWCSGRWLRSSPSSTAQAHERRGTTIKLGQTVTAIEGADGAVTGVRLDDATLLPADLVLVGIGVHARGELAEHMGLEVENSAVVVDSLRADQRPARRRCR